MGPGARPGFFHRNSPGSGPGRQGWREDPYRDRPREPGLFSPGYGYGSSGYGSSGLVYPSITGFTFLNPGGDFGDGFDDSRTPFDGSAAADAYENPSGAPYPAPGGDPYAAYPPTAAGASPYPYTAPDGSSGYPAQPGAGSPPPGYAPYGYPPPQVAVITVAPPAQEEVVTLFFRDGRPPEQIRNYALTRSTLFLTDGHVREIPLEELDLPLTERVNRAAGVDFRLPTPN